MHKTHLWNQFVKASADNAQNQFGQKNFFLLADVTQGQFGTQEYPTVEFSVSKLRDLGLWISPLDPNPMWSNGDYSWYLARNELPEYDFYVISEFDVWFNLDFEKLIDHMLDYNLDVLVPDYQEPPDSWYHHNTASWLYDPVCSMLTVFGVYASGWLDHMYKTRWEWSKRASAEILPSWPFVEAFLGSESRKINSRVGILSHFYDTTKCRYAPEYPASLISEMQPGSIIHPIKKF